ncbi:hypothetical protein BV22DRAFT_1199516 [Leucogyrophana mollusca]|uniref:Uncharacterized protein n=1 Tax=Leucogyrophana mollusca TaxID=85980 RepID=A0ACB8B1G3_9AGAM|nr:hypothetical protein BV22DRAFT_1199516 [Leucogyrophana mollusca]
MADPTGLELVAIACVVDSSILLASAWPKVLVEYIIPLLKRLSELHPGYQFRLAVVTYGAADTHPSPLLSKRFFSPLQPVTRELREEPTKLGIGTTNSVGGLSALEGLVAAIELFDILMASANTSIGHGPNQSSQKEARSFVSHIIHIAACPPDSAQRPQCNSLQHLDAVSWESLPLELKKRKINLSLISLRQITKFQDLQKLMASNSGQSPWFAVRSPHSVQLAGFPSPQKASAKRVGDASLADHNADPKRPKIVPEAPAKTLPGSPALVANQPVPPSHRHQPPQLTQPSNSFQNSAPQPPNPPSLPPTTQPLPSQPQRAAQNPPTLTQPPQRGIPPISQMMERMGHMEQELKALELQMGEAQNSGQTALFEDLRSKRGMKIQLALKLREIITQQIAKRQAERPAASQLESAVGSQSNPHIPAPPSSHTQSSITSGEQGVSGDTASAAGQHGPPPLTYTRTGSAGFPPVSNSTAGVAAQMQKLIDQKGIRPQSLSALPQPPPAPQSQDPKMKPPPTSHNFWQGTFTWTPPHPGVQGPKEMHAQLVAVPLVAELHADTWPRNMVLTASKESLCPPEEFQAWIKRHSAIVAQFRGMTQIGDEAGNQQALHSLSTLLTERNVYALSAWTTPRGTFSINIVLYPLASGLLGAVFPMTGVPDLPRGSIPEIPKPPSSMPAAQGGSRLPPELMARLQEVEPAHRNRVLQQFLHQQYIRQRQAQQQSQAPSHQQGQNVSGMPISSSYGGGIAGNSTINPFGSPSTIPQPLLNTGVGGQGSGMGQVNYEMLQSFMQRKDEGSSGQGMKP